MSIYISLRYLIEIKGCYVTKVAGGDNCTWHLCSMNNFIKQYENIKPMFFSIHFDRDLAQSSCFVNCQKTDEPIKIGTLPLK